MHDLDLKVGASVLPTPARNRSWLLPCPTFSGDCLFLLTGGCKPLVDRVCLASHHTLKLGQNHLDTVAKP